jgi:hypothetical protein
MFALSLGLGELMRLYTCVALAHKDKKRLYGICRDTPPNVGRIANPTYAVPPDVLANHGDSQ